MHPEYTFSSHYHQIGSNRLHYLDEGEGPVIVAVHGNPTWSFYYRKVVERLRATHRVIAVDNMGCGLSDKPQKYQYTLQQHIENLADLLGNLNIDRFSLIVHDWGGAIGMGLATRNPAAIDKITILNTAAFRSRRIPFRIRLCRWPIVGELMVRGMNGFAWPATYMALRNQMDKSTRRAYLLPYNSWANRIATYKFVKDIPLSPSHPSYNTLVAIEEDLEKIRQRNIPMIILWGGSDFCFTREFYDEWKRRFPYAESHYFEECGHYVVEDCPGRILPYLEKFYQEQ